MKENHTLWNTLIIFSVMMLMVNILISAYIIKNKPAKFTPKGEPEVRWTPSVLSTLMRMDGATENAAVHYGNNGARVFDGKGLLITENRLMEPLIRAGLAENFSFDMNSMSGMASRLTDDGKAVVKILRGLPPNVLKVLEETYPYVIEYHRKFKTE